MDNTHTTSFTETCTKCDKLMRTEDGGIIGGLVRCLEFDNDTIWSTTCWECVLSE